MAPSPRFPLLPPVQALKPHIQHLIDCRPHSIAMGNAIKWLRGQIHGLRRDVQAEEARRTVVDAIDTYITERITFAAETLARFAIEKVRAKGGGRGWGRLFVWILRSRPAGRS
jgi:translation initiation factor 2B subunit (eIF-2B alpha/beta/delta family)